MKEVEADPIMCAKILSELFKNPKGVARLLERSGLKGKIDHLSDIAASGVSVVEHRGELCISVKNQKLRPLKLESLDNLLVNVLGLKRKGFFPLYKAILSDPDIISTLLIAYNLKEATLGQK